MNKTVKEKFNYEILIKSIVYLIIAGFLVFITWYLDAYVLDPSEKKLISVDKIESQVELFLPTNGILRFYEDEERPFDYEQVFFDPKRKEYVIRLNSGKVWGNFGFSDAKVNILVDRSVIIPDKSVFSLNFEDGRIDLATYNGDTYVGFLNENIFEVDYADQFSNRYLNVLLLSKDSQLRLSVSRITNDFVGLLPQKLMKSMDLYGAISQSLREESFVVENLKKDFLFLESLKNDIRNLYRSGRYRLDSSLFGAFLSNVRSNLTFVTERSLKNVHRRAFDSLNSAIYYSINSDKTNLKNALNNFDYLVSRDNLFEDEDFFLRFSSYLDLLSVFDITDNEYLVFEHFLLQKDIDLDRAMLILSVMRRNFYKAMDYDEEYFNKSIFSYFDFIKKNRSVLLKSPKYYDFIDFQNQILDNLLLRNSVFYTKEFFELKKWTETELLGLTTDRFLYNETLQSFISLKIEFLNRAWIHLRNERLSLSFTKDIFQMLFDDINAIIEKEDLGDVAVMEIFKTQLQGLYDKYSYLNNIQYSTSMLYGMNHEERFSRYMRDRDIIPDFSRFFLFEDQVEEDLQRTLDNLYLFFSQNNLSDVIIEGFENPQQRFVKFSASISGYNFNAELDRHTNTLRNVYAYEQLISERSVRISGLVPLFERQFVIVDDLSQEDKDLLIESHAQRVARNFVLQKINEFGFEASLDDVRIVTTETSVFRITDARVKDMANLFLTFDYVSTDEKVRNVYLDYEGSPIVLDGVYDLGDLKNLIISRSVFIETVDEVLQMPEIVE